MQLVEDGIPRRSRIDLYTTTEKILANSIEAIENLGADPLLTEAISLVQLAKNKVSDYEERQPKVKRARALLWDNRYKVVVITNSFFEDKDALSDFCIEECYQIMEFPYGEFQEFTR
jgi:hypothetical protein